MSRIAVSIAACCLLLGCPPERGEGGDPRSVDILLVVDNSNSMARIQEELQNNLPGALAGQIEGGLDFQLGVTTTTVDTSGNGNQGNLRSLGALGGSGCETPALATSEDEDLLGTLVDLIDVGVAGSGSEQGTYAAALALCKAQPDSFWSELDSRPATSPVRLLCSLVPSAERSCNEGFLREGGSLAILLVTDEGDEASIQAGLPPSDEVEQCVIENADDPMFGECDCRIDFWSRFFAEIAPDAPVHAVGPTYQGADQNVPWCDGSVRNLPGPCNPFGSSTCAIDFLQVGSCMTGGLFWSMEVTTGETCELANFEAIATDFANSL
ncbi:MAG: hypothetical protein GY898_28245 [Proteobacteria bacterium]|nr:hypothetical protein [Pseudomonadota bacterium]